MGLVLGGEALELGKARGGQRHDDGAAVGLARAAADEAQGLEPVHDGGGVAVGDEEHP